MGRRGALGQPPPAWQERRKEVIPWCTVHHSPPLETQRLRKLLLYWSFGYRWLLGQRRNKNKTKQRILHPALLRGREWCGHHLPTSSSLHLWVARLRASCTCACRRVWRGPGRAGRPVCDRLHDAARWKAAAAAWERGRPQGGAHGDEQAEGLQPEWKQQRVSSGAWCAWSPQSASVLPKTAGHSSRQRRRKGRSVTREHSGTVPSPAPSCQWDTARDGAPGPQAWTSHDPETVRSPSSLGARGPSQHAAHVEPPGRAHPRAGFSVLWPDGPAVTPWRVGQKPPPHRLYKHCQWGLTSTYRPVRGDTVHPAEWKRLLDTTAWPQTAPQRGCPCTPKRLHHRGWWGGRSHKVYFGQ